MKRLLLALSILLTLTQCDSTTTDNTNTKKKTTKASVAVPAFSGDSAYVYVAQQVKYGPRVPNTSAHDSCATYLKEKLESFGAKVTVQAAKLRAFDGTVLNAKNIIGSYKPESKFRIALMSHWDSRPFADMEKDAADKKRPILGANDGASGVGVLLEIARQLQKQQPGAGIDLILFDAEDYGAPRWVENAPSDSWCLGSQYWAKNPHVRNYRAHFGVLLDMVGAKNAVFTREAISEHYAPNILDKVWGAARDLGYSMYFSDKKTPQIIDDHMYVNKLIDIPTIDIIHYDENSTSHTFGEYWHTHSDNMDAVDNETLKAVGQTLLEVIYNE